MYIQTVIGKLEPHELGVCACHEHLYVDLSRIKKDDDTCLEDIEVIIEDLNSFVSLGGKALVEVTNDGMGRNIQKLVEISRKTGVHIIASTGCYKDPFIPDSKLGWDRDDFGEWMVDEITEGIQQTGIKPGVIGEIGSSYNEFKPIETELFYGAIQAAKQTKLPLSTHTTLGTCALEQITLFQNEGLPLNKVVIGHQDLNVSDDSVLEVLKSGAFAALDTIGKENYRTDADRIESLMYFLEEGFEDQLLLSGDLTRKSHLKRYGGQGYDVVLRTFVPELKKRGVSSAVIKKLLVENPQKAFSIG
ncbi:phosphotriesterase [Metabacillus indicus]|uniref:phosphotriesterase family protein n=1 Tax=Metabacillus indicus TaxID=246786 RepID=UPI002A0392F0|nr:phosphotriesterase [Metabacillus indicus]MDX8291455.1 phosphotriesterase [Metabacillus indicus]